jgi:hypothetical protein
VKKTTDIFFFFFTTLNFVFSQKNLQQFEARDMLLTEKRMRCKKSSVFFLSVVCEHLTSTYVLKIISYEICSSLLLTVFMCLLTSKLHVFKSCCEVPSFRSNVHFAF